MPSRPFVRTAVHLHTNTRVFSVAIDALWLFIKCRKTRSALLRVMLLEIQLQRYLRALARANDSFYERNSFVNRLNIIEPLYRWIKREKERERERSTDAERKASLSVIHALTLSDCIPNVVLEERVTIRIRSREESGPTGFPLIVPDAMDDTVCRNAHGVVCPFERLRNGHVLRRGDTVTYHVNFFFFFL